MGFNFTSGLNRLALKFEDNFWSGVKVEKIKEDIANNPTHPYESIFLAGIKEWELATKNKNIINIDVMVLEKRLERSMGSTLNKEMISIEKNTTFSWLIPLLIVVAFAGKGVSLYIARLLIISSLFIL